MERSKVWEAAQRHKDGYNCCQAVVCTYCDRLGMELSDVIALCIEGMKPFAAELGIGPRA